MIKKKIPNWLDDLFARISSIHTHLKENWEHLIVILKFLGMALLLIGAISGIGYYFATRDPDFFIESIPHNTEESLREYMNRTSDICDESFINRLKLVNVKFYEEKNKINKQGTLIVLDILAPTFMSIFKDLYKKKVVISSIKPIMNYGIHEISEADNNVMSYMCQKDLQEKFGGYNYLYHLGAGIDLDPLYNPTLELAASYGKNDMLFKAKTFSIDYINRAKKNPYYNESVVEIFAKHGITEWGGNFSNKQKNHLIDWGYFGVNPIIMKLIMEMTADDAKQLIDITGKYHVAVQRLNKDEFYIQMLCAYRNDPNRFFRFLRNSFKKIENISDSEFFNLLNKECQK